MTKEVFKQIVRSGEVICYRKDLLYIATKPLIN
jgi:hypothetical protein